MLDFETIVDRDKKLEKRMEKSGFMDYETYKKTMDMFEKRMKKEDTKGTFSVDRFIKFANGILSEFGVKIESKRKKNKKDNKKVWVYSYFLKEERKLIAKLCA